MTHQPAGARLVQETAHLARAVASGRATRDEAERLITLGRYLAHRTSATWSARQRHSPDPAHPAAINLRNAVGNAAAVSTAGHIRAALAARPGMPPHDYLTSLGLATLPAWPLPDHDAALIVVYRRGGTGFAALWNAIGSGDTPGADRALAKLTEAAISGPDDSWRGSPAD